MPVEGATTYCSWVDLSDGYVSLRFGNEFGILLKPKCSLHLTVFEVHTLNEICREASLGARYESEQWEEMSPAKLWIELDVVNINLSMNTKMVESGTKPWKMPTFTLNDGDRTPSKLIQMICLRGELDFYDKWAGKNPNMISFVKRPLCRTRSKVGRCQV